MVFDTAIMFMHDYFWQTPFVFSFILFINAQLNGQMVKYE